MSWLGVPLSALEVGLRPAWEAAPLPPGVRRASHGDGGFVLLRPWGCGCAAAVARPLSHSLRS